MRSVSVESDPIYKKKNTYAFKTPRVVALQFIYSVEYIIISNDKRGEK